MEKNIEILNDIYQNAEMGIIGIDDVIYKIKDEKLKKEIIKEKKEYQKILKCCEKVFDKYKCKPKKITQMTKISSCFYSEMKLIKDNSDSLILKMMIEGSYKSVGILTTKIIINDEVDKTVRKVGEKLINLINDNISELKKFNKFC